jgi:hypothetical protein
MLSCLQTRAACVESGRVVGDRFVRNTTSISFPKISSSLSEVREAARFEPIRGASWLHPQ